MIGLGVMGASLARNIHSHGFAVSVYNRHYDKTKALMDAHGDDNFIPAKSLKAFVQSIKRPRPMMIMVKAGPAVDAVIAQLLPHLDKGDIIIDGGNSHYKDTQRRNQELLKQHVHFVGAGISGGEEGALNGPSIMPGGTREAWKCVKPMFEAIAAKDFSGGPCVTYVGDDGAGHYVKMVHNGIEYAIMQMIAETYDLFSTVYKLNPDQIADIFAGYNHGKLESFLLEIAEPILRKKDSKKGKSGYIIDTILDQASNKGTGTWASLDALDRGVAIPSITAAVYARYMSSEKKLRVSLNDQYPTLPTKPPVPLKKMIKLVEDGMYAASISMFAQGFDLIKRAAKEEGWKVNMKEIARIWEGGCIIRAKMLTLFKEAYNASPKPPHLFASSAVQKTLTPARRRLFLLMKELRNTGLPFPAFSSAHDYGVSMTRGRLPANMIQGQRDYFGAHTYKRIDAQGDFHTNWD